MKPPLIYMIRADITADYVEPHHEWYARRHAPDLMAAGFWSARGYDSPTSPILWNVYEVPDAAIFSSDAYNSGHRADPFLETAVKKLHGRTVSLYTQVRIVDANGREMERARTLLGRYLASLRLATTADASSVTRWFADRVVEAHKGAAGLRSIRLWEQRESHPKWPTTEPRWSVGVEWDTQAQLERAQVRRLLADAAAAPELSASVAKIDVVWKRYGLLRDDVFDDLA